MIRTRPSLAPGPEAAPAQAPVNTNHPQPRLILVALTVLDAVLFRPRAGVQAVHPCSVSPRFPHLLLKSSPEPCQEQTQAPSSKVGTISILEPSHALI